MQESVWVVEQKLRQEKLAVERIRTSLKQWEQINTDVSTGVTNLSTSCHEWQIRFECQYQYNKMLMKQIQRMRAEIRMLRNGNELPESLEAIKNFKTIGDWRRQIKDLSVEKCSLISLQSMYERQLDTESSVYHRARDRLQKLTKDVRNSFEARIHEQELADRKQIPEIPLTNSPRKKWNKLKPIAHILPFKLVASQNIKDKGTNNYTNRFQIQRQTEQALNQSTFSGLAHPVQKLPNPVTEIPLSVPQNTSYVPVRAEAVPACAETNQENILGSSHVTDDNVQENASADIENNDLNSEEQEFMQSATKHNEHAPENIETAAEGCNSHQEQLAFK
ncbi:hypothetical protein ACF0H5_004255 [Mactra antiquata]